MSKTNTICPTPAISIGCEVSIALNQGALIKIIIKTPSEVDPDNYIISNESPLGRALLAKKKGDKFSYSVGPRIFEGVVLGVAPEEESRA